MRFYSKYKNVLTFTVQGNRTPLCRSDNSIKLYGDFNHFLLSCVHRRDENNFFGATAVCTFRHAWPVYFLKKQEKEEERRRDINKHAFV